jgi:hypothetical protein
VHAVIQDVTLDRGLAELDVAGVREFASYLQHHITLPILVVFKQLNMLRVPRDVSYQTPSRSPTISPPVSSRTRANSRIEFDTPIRVRVKTKFEDGLSRAQIRAETGVPERTQRHITNTTASDRRPGKYRLGAQPKISRKLLY